MVLLTIAEFGVDLFIRTHQPNGAGTATALFLPTLH